ncbi:hypothetical protein [Amycolatopsis pigmentata]|uniref:Uncharacterized protein n=1 Tax=Amycolatopsis pigmentata TaxID=450801 RepID=A0ABW5FS60_9PSEU
MRFPCTFRAFFPYGGAAEPAAWKMVLRLRGHRYPSGDCTDRRRHIAFALGLGQERSSLSGRPQGRASAVIMP